MYEIDNTQAQSVTATICEQAQLYGATPERDEFDPRDVSGTAATPSTQSSKPSASSQKAGPDGFQLADECAGAAGADRSGAAPGGVGAARVEPDRGESQSNGAGE